MSATAAPARQPGVPPKFLNIVRQTLKRGAAPAYLDLEATIVRAYDRAKVPLYWLCLQAPKTPPEILYLNLFDTPDGLDRAAVIHEDTIKRHPDIARLLQKLTGYASAPPTSTLTARRDEFDYARRGVDFATMGALRVVVFHVEPGHEGEFVDAVQTGRAVPWQIYEDRAAPTFYLLVPMRSPSDRKGGGLPRGLRHLKRVYRAEKPIVYAVRPAMSHMPH